MANRAPAAALHREGIASVSLVPLKSGTRLGSYEIRSPIGAGGIGEVYRAYDGRLDREVAINVVPCGLQPGESMAIGHHHVDHCVSPSVATDTASSCSLS